MDAEQTSTSTTVTVTQEARQLWVTKAQVYMLQLFRYVHLRVLRYSLRKVHLSRLTNLYIMLTYMTAAALPQVCRRWQCHRFNRLYLAMGSNRSHAFDFLISAATPATPKSFCQHFKCTEPGTSHSYSQAATGPLLSVLAVLSRQIQPSNCSAALSAGAALPSTT